MSKREVETSPAESSVAVSAFAHHTPGMVAEDFTGLEKEGFVMACNPDYNSGSCNVQENSHTAEAQTASGRQCGMDAFRLMAEAAVDQGYLTPEGFNRVMSALEVQG